MHLKILLMNFLLLCFQLFTEFMLIVKQDNCVAMIAKMKQLFTNFEGVMPSKPEVKHNTVL